MHQRQIIFLGAIFMSCALLQTGCASLYYSARSNTTTVYGLLKSENTLTKIRAGLPAADHSVAFQPQVMASGFSAMRDALLREQKYYSGFNLPPPTRDALLWGYEDYTITGPIDDSEDVEGIGMIDGMSLGLATPFVIPMLNDQIAREKVHVRTIRVWYDAHLHYYAHQMLYDSAWKDRPPGADLSFAKAIWF